MAPTQNLTNLLSWPSRSSTSAHLPPAGSSTLISDTTGSPGLFMLVHFLRSALLESKAPRPIIWISCDASGSNHLTSIARRVGVNLNQYKEKGLFRWIDACDEEENSLKRLFALVKSALNQVTTTDSVSDDEPSGLIIVDDISSIQWNLSPSSLNSTDEIEEASAQTVGRWAVAMRHLCQEYNASMIFLAHTPSPTDYTTQHLFTRLYRTSSTWIEIKELSSGKARDCSGEITVHDLSNEDGFITPALGRSKAVLFNIGNDGLTTMWPRGAQI
ncbi:unnamed protein product [Sympodiomycopsis kandeliae]